MVHMSIDNDEQLEKLCHKCKTDMESNKCMGCGSPMITERENNPNFDDSIFEELKKIAD